MSVFGPEPLSTEPKFLPDPPQIAHLRELLRSNSLLPETTHFRHVVEIAPAEIARYDSEIEQLRVVLEKLMADRATLHAYADGCRSIVAPIRRLPPEVLVQIFWLVSPAMSDVISDTITPDQELDRLAKKELLILSKVCSHWRSVVMNTPMLWSSIALDTLLWDACPASGDTLLDLLSQCLERGGSHPLRLHVAPCEAPEYDRQVWSLLTQHSQRWRDVHAQVDEEFLDLLSQVREHLPSLETLTTSVWDGIEAVDVFAIAPRLTKVKFAGPFAFVPTLPWAQLQSFTCTQIDEADFRGYLYLARRLGSTAEFQLKVDASKAPLPLDLHSTVSQVETFHLSIRLADDREHAREVLGGIFGCLTLPYIQDLLIQPGFHPSPPVSWSHTEFLTLASRSLFHDTLTTLNLARVLITADELLECLSVLPLLQQLDLQDYHESDGYAIPDHAVITDKLLHALIPADNEDCLVPHLKYLGLSSLLRFTDSTYLSFVRSRVDLGRDRRPPFEISLWWIPGHKCELAPECVFQLSELVQQGDLIFAFEQDPDW